jgi:hypothetical protein
LWVSYWFKYSSNYQWEPTQNKHFYFKNFISTATPDSSNLLIFGIRGGRHIPSVSIAGGVGNWYQNVGSTELNIVPGRWYKFKGYFHMNTNGSDGGWKIWIDDQLVIDNPSGMPLRRSSQFGGEDVVKYFDWEPIWGGAMAGCVNQDMYLYADDIILSTTDPGGGGGGVPDTTAPYVTSQSPTMGATGVSRTNRTISATIQDAAAVVTRSSVTMGVSVNGGTTQTYSNGSGLSFVPNNSSAGSFVITRVQGSDWNYGDVVGITINGADNNGNVMPAVAYTYAIAANPSTYELTWSDEFNYYGCTAAAPCTFDPSKWQARTGTLWQDEPVDVPWYTSRTKNIRVQDGSLIIEAHKENLGGKLYTSGSIETWYKKHFQFGKLEIRAKGTSTVNLIDQAIWTLGATGPCGGSDVWPYYGEVDIVEYYPAKVTYGFTRVLQNVHTSDHTTSETPVTMDGRQWHTYFMEWDNTVLKLGIDGTVYKTVNKTTGTCEDWPFQDPLFLLMTIQIGTIGGTGSINPAAFPLSFEIDYVRYYQLGATPPTPLSITTSSPLPTGTVGQPYSNVQMGAYGGTSPYEWSVISGSLPPGMTLSAGGLLSGTPTVAVTTSFTVRVTDNVAATASLSLSILINPLLPGGQTTVTGTSAIFTLTGSDTEANDNFYGYMVVWQWPSATVANRVYLQDNTAKGLPDNILITDAILRLRVPSTEGWVGSGGTNPMRIHAYNVTGSIPNLHTVTWNTDTSTRTEISVTDVPLAAGWSSWNILSAVQAAKTGNITMTLALDGGQDGALDTNRTFDAAEIVITYTQLVGPAGPSISAPGKFRVSRLKGKVR